MKKQVRRGSRPIVVGHLEKISSGVFEDFPEQVTGLIKKGQGVYALYRRNKLYYIGLAGDLRGRVKWHLKDRHKGKWDRFSLYMIRKTDHIREVESLLVRIADPDGNKQRGKLKVSKNLKRALNQAIRKRQEEKRIKIFGDHKGKAKRKKTKKKGRKTKVVKERPLRGVFPGGKVIYAKYKGNTYKAWIKRNGGIRFKGKIYDSPTGAAQEIIEKGAVNGWNFWKYKDKAGNLIKLRTLRK